MKIESIKISKLKAAPYNPRTSTAKQEDNLKASLEKFGVVEPVVYNKQTGNIVGGHFRVRELKKMGVKEVPCVVVDLSIDDEKELNIRLNANTGEWDWEALANEWDTEQLDEWGLEVWQAEDNMSNNNEYQGLDQLGKLDKFMDAELKRLYLVYDAETFNKVVAWFEKLCVKYGCDNNSELVLKLMENDHI